MNDDYLWDKSGPPDPELVALERRLEAYRHAPERELDRVGRELESTRSGAEAERRERGPERPAGGAARERGRSRPRRRVAVAVAAAVLALASVLLAVRSRAEASPYRFEALAGTPTVGGDARGRGRLAFGERIECGPGSRARVHVGDIGSVELEPGSRLAARRAGDLPATDGAGYLLDLERGTVTASIFAAPRLFQLGTPAGLAVDLGCIYEATAEPNGTTLLRVVHGFVSFETPERRVLVPSGALARAYPGRGPGTPVWEDAPEELQRAARAIDEGTDALDAELATVLRTARAIDSLTLWHLLDLEQRADRVVDRLAELIPPPPGVTASGVLAGDPAMRERWKRELGWGWK
jgi:hypothetical protein